MHPSRKPFRLGAVLGILLAAVVFLPGTAWAGNEPAVPAPAVPRGAPGPLGSMFATGGPNSGSVTSDEQPGTSQADPALPPPPGGFGFSPECQEHVQADLTKAIQDIPASIQAIVDAIVAGLGNPPSPPTISITDPVSKVTYIITFLSGSQPPTVSSSPPDVPTLDDLQKLAADLQKFCSPQPPTTAPAQSAAAQSSAPVAAPAAVTTSAPPAPTTAAVAAAYPGYAPTGGRPVGPDPLAVVGAGLLLVGSAGSVGYRLHRHAARHRG